MISSRDNLRNNYSLLREHQHCSYSLMDLSLERLENAISLRTRISQLEAQLAKVFGGSTAPQTRRTAGSKRTRVSAATRAKIAAAQRARWARVRGKSTVAAKPIKKKGGLTPTGRKKLSEGMRARWAAMRATSGAPKSAPRLKGKKGGLTAAGRKKLSQMMKARWAARRKGKPASKR